jgi:flavin-dependent dehydrogenase
MWDAIVAGAGPAGAMAALILSRAGHRTLLTDRIGSDRFRIGETLPEAAGRLLRSIGLPAPETDGPHAAVGGVFLSWNSDELIALDSFRSPAGHGWRLDRKRFDADLRTAAIAAGAAYRNDRELEGAHAADARGARLKDVFGEGWIACGDAAMSFDPISGQGIFSALHGGLTAGTAVAAALNRRTELIDEYSARINDVWTIYRKRLRSIYQSERRWPAACFWSRWRDAGFAAN